MIHQPKLAPIIFVLITFIFSLQLFGQTTVVNDPLNGSTVGEKVGGSFSSEGYKPGKGENHILYKLPQITNGYIEFEVKGFHPSNMPSDEDHAFAILYDGRGISEPVKYYNDFKYNYFRWNFHWRGNKSAFKAVITCANPTTARINSTYAVFPGGGDLRDWFSEPTGKGWSWNASTWYKMKIEWKDKKFSASVNGTVVWSTSGPNDYAPKDLRIWLGSGPDKYNSDVSDQVFRNFKVVSYGGTVTPTNSLSLSPSSQNVGSTAGSTNLTVSSNVSWSASSNASWLSVTPTSGSNNNTLTANFGVNSSSSSRTATVTVTGGGITRTATITQAGTSSTTNTLAVTPASQSVGSSSGTTNFSIASNVSWAVSDNASWLNVSPTSGSNNSSLNVTFDQNTSTSSRTATITTVGGGITRTVSVTQAGTSTNGGGNFITVPEILNLPNSYGKITVNVQSNVSWKVSDNTGTPGWLSKTPKTGTGNGQVIVTYQANSTGSSREGSLIFVGGGLTKIIRVIQGNTGGSNVSGDYLTVPETLNLSAKSGNIIIDVKSNINWIVSDNTGTPGWLSKKPKTGIGDGKVTLIYQENLTGQSRTGSLIFRNINNDTIKTIKITQSANGALSKANNSDVNEMNAENVEIVEIPTEYSLGNYPNPFNPTTTIQFSLPKAGNTELTVYNSLGQVVKTLVSEYKSEGTYSLLFNASELSSGIYFYTLRSGNFIKTSKMMLLE